MPETDSTFIKFLILGIIDFLQTLLIKYNIFIILKNISINTRLHKPKCISSFSLIFLFCLINRHTAVTRRREILEDLRDLITLLSEDEFGQNRERSDSESDQNEVEAFHKIDLNPNQYLMVVESHLKIVASCQLTFIPSLTFRGSTRLQIEAVHVFEKQRGQGIGEWLITQTIKYGKSHGATIIQLTSNKKRVRAKKFYEQLGFQASHEGLKLYLKTLVLD